MSIVRPDFEKLADRSSDGYFCHRFDDGLVYVSPGFAALAGRSAERLAESRQRLHGLLCEDEARQLEALLSQILDGQTDELSAVFRFVRPDGSTVRVEMFMIAVDDSTGKRVGVDEVARDVSEHLEVAALLSRRSHQQAALLDAQRLLLTTLDLERSIERVVTHARELLEASHSTLFMIDPETDAVRNHVIQDASDDEVSEQAEPIVRWVIDQGKSVRMDPIDPRGLGSGLAAVLPEGGSLLAAPLQVGQAGMGALTVIGGAGQYTEEDLAFLSALAQVGSLALANSSTYRAMERLASIDGLTGAYNRRFFEANLPADVERANRLGYPLSLMMIDIDYLKRINDQRGHVARDRSLQHVVESMRSRIRETDWIARYGGDEFIVLLPGCSAAHLQQLGQDLLSHLRGQDVPGLDVGVRVHSSVGAISAKGGSIIASELIKAVDSAELQAKSKGGDQMVLGTLETDANRPASSA